MKTLISILLMICVGAMAFGQAPIRKTYSGIRPDDTDGRKGLLNPERGFRWENRIGSFEPQYADHTWLSRIKSERLTVTQAYCELLDYYDAKVIPEEKLKRLEESFAEVRKSGLKMLLCFRYEMFVKDEKGPTLEITLAHIEHLKPILQRNMDIIAVLQTGFVGQYGEWHRSYHKLDKDHAAQEQILSALLDILPEDRKMVMRYLRHKNPYIERVSGRSYHTPITAGEAHSMRPEARIGFCDHGFMVGKTDASTFAPRPSKDYDHMTQESLFVPMDAELFWAWSRPWGVLKDDGLEAIKRLWEHHYTLFSYAHNNTGFEGDWAKEKYNARFSIDEWRTETITPEFLKTNDLPYSDNYFKDASGKLVPRTVCEYIRDHLGYRLELTKGSYPEKASAGRSFKAKFSLVNRGFAAPINPRGVYLVLIGDDKVYTLAKAKADVREWYPCLPNKRTVLAPEYELSVNGAVPRDIVPGKYKLGIWMPDDAKTIHEDARYSIRLANRDVSWWTGTGNSYGINVIGDVTVSR